jgi:excisionase family DNA binding protein
MDELLTTQQAAERLGITDSRVRQLVLEGRLPAQKFGRSNMIRAADLKAVEGIKRGRPPKAKTAKTESGRKKGKRNN